MGTFFFFSVSFAGISFGLVTFLQAQAQVPVLSQVSKSVHLMPTGCMAFDQQGYFNSQPQLSYL